MSTLKDRINADIKDAMRNRDSARLSALRLLSAAVKQREVDERIELDDPAVQRTIEKLVKQRRDAESQYAAAGRNDLAQAEAFEATLLSAYLPAQLTPDALQPFVEAAIAQTGASSPADLGKLMAVLKPQLAGKADMAQVSALLRERLNAMAG